MKKTLYSALASSFLIKEASGTSSKDISIYKEGNELMNDPDGFFKAFPSLRGKITPEDVDINIQLSVQYYSTPYSPLKTNPVDSSHPSEGGDFEITNIGIEGAELYFIDVATGKPSKKIDLKIEGNVESYLQSLISNLKTDKKFLEKLNGSISNDQY